MGDALAVAMLEARGFTEEDFARSHPGRHARPHGCCCTSRTSCAAATTLPAVSPDTLLSAGLLEMSRKGLGMTAIVDERRRVIGVFTDGDLRRALDRQRRRPPDTHAAMS